VQRFGGFVAKYMGDGDLIYFGYPQETSIWSREAQRAAPPADGSGTMCHR
jgi:class 3 adenylate cyclase